MVSLCLSIWLTHATHADSTEKFFCVYIIKKKKTIAKDLVFSIHRYRTNTKNTGVERPKNSFLLRLQFAAVQLIKFTYN